MVFSGGAWGKVHQFRIPRILLILTAKNTGHVRRYTDEINDSGSFFNMSQYMRIYLATRRILTFEFGAVLN